MSYLTRGNGLVIGIEHRIGPQSNDPTSTAIDHPTVLGPRGTKSASQWKVPSVFLAQSSLIGFLRSCRLEIKRSMPLSKDCGKQGVPNFGAKAGLDIRWPPMRSFSCYRAGKAVAELKRLTSSTIIGCLAALRQLCTGGTMCIARSGRSAASIPSHTAQGRACQYPKLNKRTSPLVLLFGLTRVFERNTPTPHSLKPISTATREKCRSLTSPLHIAQSLTMSPPN